MSDPTFKRETTAVLLSLGIIGLFAGMFAVTLWAFLGTTPAAMALTATLVGLFVAAALLALIAVRWEGARRRTEPPSKGSAH